MPDAIQKYLEELERELKRQPGVSPEEALSDAREFLVTDAMALSRSGEGPGVEDVYRQIVETFGSPAKVARQYAAETRPVFRRPGFAPGWRICCTRCGRSAPLSRVGGVRTRAKSWHKYTIGFCSDCRRLRFFRIIKDMDAANLTQRLGERATPADLRRSMHHPWLVLLIILLGVLAASIVPAIVRGDELC